MRAAYFKALALAGAVDGGGGKGVVCRDQSGKISSAELLDLYEGRVQFGFNIPSSPDSVDFEDLILISAGFEEVERIFVNAVVKKKLCQKYPEFSQLNKIRPWYFHESHFHVRMKCPADLLSCEKQKPVNMSSGCGKELDWWFSEEALQVWLQKSDKPVERAFSLPSQCDFIGQ